MTNIPRPDGLPEAPPYANATYTFVNNELDVTICFLRSPLMDDAAVAELVARGGGAVESPVVTAVTLPRARALALADYLQRALSSGR